jgi:23S rRNA pseudouridine1911/1915/1917 synthase
LRKQQHSITESDVLYEDNHVIILNKKPSEIVQVDEGGDEPLCEKVKAFLKKKYNKQGNVFLGVTHRLDRPVSGAILFAKTSKALTRLNAMFQAKTIQKTYWALTLKQPRDKEALLKHYLVKDRTKNKTKAYRENVPNSKYSELRYKLIEKINANALLEVTPLTGRSHQIRTQLASIGCSIKGDLKYGATEPNPDKSICLHSRKIEFIHPVNKQNISVIAPLHKNDYWGIK